jgi:L-fuconolactonase
MTVDSHQHFWEYDPLRDTWIDNTMSVLKRDFLPPALSPILLRNKIDASVVVQVQQSEQENEFLLSLTDKYEFIKAVVGWVDLQRNDLDEKLQYFSQFKKLKGFRHIVQGEAPGFLLQPKFIHGVNLLAQPDFTYDLLVYHHQLPEVLNFLTQTREVKIVVDHLAKPSIRSGEVASWRENITKVASFKNVSCKLSGMVTEAVWKGWKKETFTPYIETVFEAFGTDRILYGSDWPVCLLSATYDDQLQIVTDYISTLSHSEKQMVMGINAERFYNL